MEGLTGCGRVNSNTDAALKLTNCPLRGMFECSVLVLPASEKVTLVRF